MTLDPGRWPATIAFERGDELGLWTWTYRVWCGWRAPWPDLEGLSAELRRLFIAGRLAMQRTQAQRGIFAPRPLQLAAGAPAHGGLASPRNS